MVGDVNLDPMEVVRDLARLPHRGTTTDGERRAADLLAARLEGLGAEVKREPFRSPPTYLVQTTWLLAGLIAALFAPAAFAIPAAALGAVCIALLVAFLDYRRAPGRWLPPLGRSQNLVARPRGAAVAPDRRRLILMAHYDSAPVSLLYHPKLVAGFASSLRTSVIVLGAALVVLVLRAAGVDGAAWAWVRGGFALYCVAQLAMTSLDFLRFGYTNGAADNATGVGAAMATAARLWAEPPPGLEVNLVLTGAEEAGMLGALAYFDGHRGELDPARTLVLNFDSLGAGQVRILTRTGALSAIRYDNALTRAALACAGADPRFSGVREGEWRTGDFDTAWFARAGIPSLTLSANADGVIPWLHRPGDVVEHVDASVAATASALACATVRAIANEAPR